MAQQDTGLGWSAKQEWLIEQAPATLASFTEISGGLALPTNINSYAVAVSAGFHQDTHYRDGRETYVGSYDDKPMLMAIIDTTPEPEFAYFSPVQGAKRAVATTGGGQWISTLELIGYDSKSGL